MNNRICLLLTSIFAVLLTAASESSAAPPQPVESCYIAMTIEEQKTAAGIKFLLSSYIGVVDLLGGLVSPPTGNGESYKLTVLNSSGQALGTYGIWSSRHIVGESITPDGNFSGVHGELKNSTIDLIIPHNTQIRSVRINYPGGSQSFPLNAKNIPCVKTCLAAGKTGRFNREKCCVSAAPVDIGGGNFRCQ